jgi:hypothetical protein
MKTLTVKQPWLQLLAEGIKDVENRTWHTKYRGPIALHAGKTDDPDAYHHPAAAEAFTTDDRIRRHRVQDLPRGFIVAAGELVDAHSYRTCLQPDGTMCSAWADPGAVHWVIRDVVKLDEPMTWPGSLGLRELSSATESLVRSRLVI